MANKKPILWITGAAGFIGSALAHRLGQNETHDLVLIDELGTTSKWKNLVPLRYALYLEKEDFLREFRSGRLASEYPPEAILHLGAISATTEIDAGLLMQNNVGFSQELARFCEASSGKTRLIYASSAATYGDGSLGYDDGYATIEELRPLNAYGYSKQAFDLWMKNRDGFSWAVGLKYFNVYGPNEYHKGDMRSMVMKAYEQIREHGRVQLFQSHHPNYRDGEQLRDFLHVSDAVSMTLHFLKPGTSGGLYNVGTGKARTWLDMMRGLFAAMQLPEAIDFIPMPAALQGKYQYFTEAKMERMRAAGYTAPMQTLEAGISATLPYLESGCLPLGW
jgi:ADP-L-glycero-D-manno-heptose 6-epimerase